ncbi:MAG: PAS domain-containing protein [Bacteroidales bacterium]|nr:PAS domain-containing protein [Bacteroidales bacterium]
MDWSKEINFAITVSDKDGKIIEMNDKSAETFSNYGGFELLGKSLFECHKPNSGEKIREIGNTLLTNAYTIEKNGLKKLILQTPWYKDGVFAGLVEISLVLPDNMPHFIRK